MLNYSLFINNQDVTEKFAKYSKIYGIIFLLMGLIGIFFPNLMAVTSAIFIGWLLLFSGILVALNTWQVNKKDWLGWLKAVMFIVVATLIFINPITGVIALSVLFATYFMIDSALNLSLAFSIKPKSGWFIVLLNAILSFILGAYFFFAIANPIKAMWLVGILVGISLFFDGVMLITLSKASQKES